MNEITEEFNSMVFNDDVMMEKLPKDAYNALRKSIENRTVLDRHLADLVAVAMKEWAVEKGATHFTHWFQPMTGITAEKHNSFISITENGQAITEFSGKELIKGESDASSFPSGGLRATFEARGYTAWDPTSYAFIKDKSLCIPTMFYSYCGEVLDKKTPLLRSMDALSKQAVRILNLLGNSEVKRVDSTTGAEQEYFLIDKSLAKKRKDLIFCGMTLFGAKAIKGQELEDHYFGTLRPRVSAFMKDLDRELWKLGIPAKTKHNEVAPSQHELAQIFVKSNTATDHNQLTMEMMKSIAERHDLLCLLHEKPFAGINGSGKHINWSLQTDNGINLLEPGTSPQDNAQFLIFLCAVIKAVDEYSDLLRISVASASNDCRLGGEEAPPPIVSIYLGDDILEVLNAIENGSVYNKKSHDNVKIGLNILPNFPIDTTDRNRTSPFAFTGNKFEFRMVGSSQSIAQPITTINVIVAEELKQFADILQNANNFTEELNNLLLSTIKNHKKIIFNGNNYSSEWVEEAKKRNLLNLKTTADALPYYITEKNVKLFERHNVLSKKEIVSRYEIQLENYCKVMKIKALTMIEMSKKEIFPAVNTYCKQLAESIYYQKKVDDTIKLCTSEVELLKTLLTHLNNLYFKTDELYNALNCVPQGDMLAKANFYNTVISKLMSELRKIADAIEKNMANKLWPYPNYVELLFSV